MDPFCQKFKFTLKFQGKNQLSYAIKGATTI